MTQSPTEEIDQHQQALLDAFAAILRAEDVEREVKVRADASAAQFDIERNQADEAVRKAWGRIEELMNETGEVEVVLPGAVTDYKILRSSPRESVKVDPDAVPEEFVRIERKPKLKEIGEYLKDLREARANFPNWGSLVRGESKLMWKAIRKSTT